MLDIHYFGSCRERLGVGQERLAWQPELDSVERVRQCLAARGGVWEMLQQSNLLCARNQEVCDFQQAVRDGDELAFFPPVTGG